MLFFYSLNPCKKLNLTMVQAKLKYMRDKKFIVPFKDTKGSTKYRIFYDGGFKRKTAYRDSLVDIIPNTWHTPKLSLEERLITQLSQVP